MRKRLIVTLSLRVRDGRLLFEIERHATPRGSVSWYAVCTTYPTDPNYDLTLTEICRQKVRRQADAYALIAYWRGLGQPIPMSLAIYKVCPSCDGHGRVPCDRCGGEGPGQHADNSCEVCRGEGDVPCSRCGACSAPDCAAGVVREP